jgi:hypothetical protein
MNISALSALDLTSRLKKLVQTERRITHLVLECIAEIDRRKLYLERAYSSLYEFLVHEYGYSPSSAMRRIESARLLREVPELAQKIESGALNLSHLAKVQQAIRTVQKTEDRQVPLAEKRELLKKVENATQVQTDAILARELSIPIPKHERSKINSDESITLTMTFSKEQVLVLQKIQELVSHSVTKKSWAPLFVYLAQKELGRRSLSVKSTSKIIEPESPAPSRGSQSEPALNSLKGDVNGASSLSPSPSGKFKKSQRRGFCESDDSTLLGLKSGHSEASRVRKPKALDTQKMLNHGPRRGSIPRSVRRDIFVRSAGCEYRSPLTKKICGSQRFLHVDHIRPIWAGGSNDKSNLRLLCAKHNQQRYRQQTNVTTVADVKSGQRRSPQP